MAGYRITRAAQADIVSILAWSDTEFGAQARQRYESLIAIAIRTQPHLSTRPGANLTPGR